MPTAVGVKNNPRPAASTAGDALRRARIHQCQHARRAARSAATQQVKHADPPREVAYRGRAEEAASGFPAGAAAPTPHRPRSVGGVHHTRPARPPAGESPNPPKRRRAAHGVAPTPRSSEKKTNKQTTAPRRHRDGGGDDPAWPGGVTNRSGSRLRGRVGCNALPAAAHRPARPTADARVGRPPTTVGGKRNPPQIGNAPSGQLPTHGLVRPRPVESAKFPHRSSASRPTPSPPSSSLPDSRPPGRW